MRNSRAGLRILRAGRTLRIFPVGGGIAWELRVPRGVFRADRRRATRRSSADRAATLRLLKALRRAFRFGRMFSDIPQARKRGSDSHRSPFFLLVRRRKRRLSDAASDKSSGRPRLFRPPENARLVFRHQAKDSRIPADPRRARAPAERRCCDRARGRTP